MPSDYGSTLANLFLLDAKPKTGKPKRNRNKNKLAKKMRRKNRGR